MSKLAPARPRKRFGQHFLADQDIIERTVAAIAPGAGERVLEIGPGEGALTAALARTGCDLTTLELDRDLASTLGQRLASAGVNAQQLARIRTLQGDALNTDYTALASEGAGAGYSGKLRVVGNLPYNISTPLIFHLLEHASAIADMVFMLQAEVVARLTAEPGSKQWGRLGVMTRLLARAEHLFDVPPEAFRPPPKVWSAIVRLVPRDAVPAPTERAAIAEVVSKAFSQRRKTLRNALRGCVDAQAMAAAGIAPTRRAETLSVDEFRVLATLSSTQAAS